METNKIYVAIGEEVEDRESILRWVLSSFTGKTVCVVYVHVAAKRIPLASGLQLPPHLVRKNELEAFRVQEKEKVPQLLDDCSKLCATFQVPCEHMCVEKNSITEGILELIVQLKIENLVMGAKPNNKPWRFSRLTEMSENGKNVLQSAPGFCQIWFVCKDRLVYKREAIMQPSSNVEEKPSCSSEEEGNMDDKIYNNLEKAILETESLCREAFSKSVSCWNAERKAIEAIRKAKPTKRLYYEELRLKKAMEEEAENKERMFTKVSLELSEALDHKLSLAREIEKFNIKVKELEEKLLSEVKLSQKLLIERDEALGEAQEFSQQPTLENSSFMFSEFSYAELQKATNDFDASRKIGEGSYGSMYKGFLHHTEVAIKLLAFNCVQNYRVFNQQAELMAIKHAMTWATQHNILHLEIQTDCLVAIQHMENRGKTHVLSRIVVSCVSRLRHPNLVTLIGACREPWAVVYEYLPGGPLIDKLIRHDNNSRTLPWQIRIRIAMDICSALIFLHSSNPTCTVQADLTPLKLLLDANFTCKIADYDVVSKDTTNPSNLITTRLFKPKPCENVKPVELVSDVYSFGIIVLQLLTGKPATSGIVRKVRFALEMGALDRILDPYAGDWPFIQAKQLADMALRCCDMNSTKRPDLATDVWRVLTPMRTSCSNLSLVASHDRPPQYFLCPILLETMEDPHVAADGFTYEALAIRGWFESGHDTSPMTNMKLANFNLTPNRSLRSVIQEWLQSTSTSK